MDKQLKLSFQKLLAQLKATGEATRLRLLFLLGESELTVTDLTAILGQSQPRVSRHLKLLCDAGLVERYPEGAWVYYRLSDTPDAQSFTRAILNELDRSDLQVGHDCERLERVRAEHFSAANDYFEANASDWDVIRSLHVADAAVEAAMLDLLGGSRFDTLLDVGTGTGRILELLADRVTRGVGVDASTQMLSLARAKLAAHEYDHLQVRQGDAYNLSMPKGLLGTGFDLVCVHQVLHFLDDPGRAVSELVRVVGEQGKVLVVDFAPHDLEFLRTQHAHRRLGFSHDQMASWFEAFGFEIVQQRDLQTQREGEGELTVSLWLACKAN